MSDLPQTGNTSLSAAVKDAQGSYSSRRIAAFVALAWLVLLGAAVIVSVVAKYVIGGQADAGMIGLAASFVTAMVTIAGGGLLLATADRWAPK